MHPGPLLSLTPPTRISRFWSMQELVDVQRGELSFCSSAVTSPAPGWYNWAPQTWCTQSCSSAPLAALFFLHFYSLSSQVRVLEGPVLKSLPFSIHLLFWSVRLILWLPMPLLQVSILSLSPPERPGVSLWHLIQMAESLQPSPQTELLGFPSYPSHTLHFCTGQPQWRSFSALWHCFDPVKHFFSYFMPSQPVNT